MVFEYLAILIFTLLTLEVLLFFLVKIVRKNFQWLITKNIDDKVIFDQNLLKKFKKHSFHKKLGWEPKPNTSGKDIHDCKEIKYNIGKFGQRVSYNEKNLKKNQCLIFGDSFAFSRQVSDNNTISSHLNKKSNLKFYNFGVGNYGLDQAILRFEKIYFNLHPKYVIFIIVPETICRIQSMWKHFFEYGNILAFKPRFIVDKDSLKLLRCPLKSINNAEINNAIIYSKKNDIFYKKKFQKDLIFMPYIFSLFKNNLRGLKIVLSYLDFKIKGKSIKKWKDEAFFKIVLKNNALLTKNFYKNQNSLLLMYKLFERINLFCKDKKVTPIIAMIPQIQDIHLIKGSQDYMKSFEKKLKRFKGMKFLNFTKLFLNESSKIDKIYLDKSGNHLSSFGNNFVAKKLFAEISKIKNV